MSGIAGIINFDGSPVSAIALPVMRDALTSSLQNGAIITWDGRLDNRDDFLNQFPDGLNGDKTDVALIAASYLKWGGDCFRNIIGDFALSMWEPDTKTLMLARDPFGVRSLYYYYDNKRVIWSSNLSSLITSSNIKVEIDDEFVAGFLAIYPDLFRTPYRNIHSVEPGFVISIHNGAEKKRRFWHPAIKEEIRYKCNEEYTEHFQQLFKEAILCRLISDGPIWAELSGGLDSSSIVCMADKIIEEEHLQNTQLKTISYIDDGETSYDRRYISAVEDYRGVTGYHYIRKGHWVNLASPEDEFIERPSVGLCTYGAQKHIGEVMNAEGAYVLLSGYGGDQLLLSAPSAASTLGDNIFNLRPIELHKQIKYWSNVLRRPYWDILWQDGVVPFMPKSLRAKLQNLITTPEWINKEFAAKMSLADRLIMPDDPFGLHLPSQRIHSSQIYYAVQGIVWGHHEPHNYLKTFPFLHRPLVEFMLALPLNQKFNNSESMPESRPLLRRALKNILPEKVLHRKGKGSVSETICRGISREWPAIKALLEGGRVFSRGYIDYHKLMSSLDKARHGMELELNAFTNVIALEIWLRSLEYHKKKYTQPEYQKVTS